MRVKYIDKILCITVLLFNVACSDKTEVGINDNNKEQTDVEAGSNDSTTSTIVHTIPVKNIGRLTKVFADLNDTHLSSATKIGINPITDLKSAYAVNIPIQKVESCNEFTVDSLTHSLPFLRPQAASLLKEIGRQFTDTIMSRCGHHYKIKVTSLLRTSVAIDRLKKRNRNATVASAHQYGTTFDVSYSKFVPGESDYILSQECLKNTLGEILYNLREQGRCYVKYEVKQGCFHITVR